MTNHSVIPTKQQAKTLPEVFASGHRGRILMNSNELIDWMDVNWEYAEAIIEHCAFGRNRGWKITHCQKQSERFRMNVEAGTFEKRTNYVLSQKMAMTLCKRLNRQLVPALRRAFIDEHFADIKQQLAWFGATAEAEVMA